MHPDEVEKQTALFVGAPNSGKTTLYNWVTGSRFKTVNYPGATVDYSVGTPLPNYQVTYNVVDTPGLYSLRPKTLEEEITHKLIFEKYAHASPVVIVVVDATHFTRQILLSDHLKSCGFNVVIALTMIDVVKANEFFVDVKLLEELVNVPVVEIDGRLGGGIKELTQLVQQTSGIKEDIQLTTWDNAEYEKKFRQYDQIKSKVFLNKDNCKAAHSGKFSENNEVIDKWLLHPVFGIVFFFLIMFIMFSSVFWLATPAIDFVDELFAGLANVVVNIAPGSLWGEFIGNGFIAGVGAFAVFIPQIAILFLGMSLLEDSGYLARASTLIDKPLSKLGMNGRSFVPILSSFACAVPGMMAARTIPNKNERFLTLFILPLMTCSARIPVYALLITFLVAKDSAFLAGIIMAVIYFFSLVLGGVTAGIINRFLPKSSQSFFMLELPSYRKPVFRKILKTVFDRTMAFIKRAGPVILVLSIVVWAGFTFPNYELDSAQERFDSSYATQMGKKLEPVFRPMGGDWRVGLGVISSFAAREVFVSTLAIIFNIAEDDEDMESSLLEKLREARFVNADGSQGALIFTLPGILALIVFFMVALQCLATVGIAISEFGSWKLAVFQLVAFNLAAYILAVATFQILS